MPVPSMENSEELRQLFIDAVTSRAGYPYKWGATGPEAFDCSGLVEWAFEEIGVPVGDICSSDLYSMFHSKKVLRPAARPGSLWLYSATKNPSEINHVMVMLRKWPNGEGTLIGSRGGGACTKSVAAAWASKAFVDVTTTDYWLKNLVFIVDPFL